MNENPSSKVYKVLVDDNFDYTDEERRYEHGSYSSLEDAISAAEMLVNRYLISVADSYLFSDQASNMTADELYKNYVSFGPDPFITSNTEEKISFSAWDYAKVRCQELYQASLGTLEKAISFATIAHEGQTDKAGAPYISHPLRVMSKFSTDEDRIVAVLHDVVEDCEWMTLDVLLFEGFSETVVDAIDSVTKRDGEDYDAFIGRAAANPIGRRVKLADLEDNCDLSRISEPTDRDYERIEKYRRAIEIIKSLDTDKATMTPDQAGI